MTAAMFDRVRAHLLRNPSVAYRPVPLAAAIREKDIRLVRAALGRLAASGEAVTCTVIRDGVEEKEYRISCGGPTAIYRPVLAGMNDRPVRRSEVGGKFVERDTSKGAVAPATAAPSGKDSIPEGAAASAPIVSASTAPAAPIAGSVRRPSRLHQATLPFRQRQVIELLEQADRPLFPFEVIERVSEKDPGATDTAVRQVLSLLYRRGAIARLSKAKSPRTSHGQATNRYASLGMGRRVAEEERVLEEARAAVAVEQAAKSPDRAAAPNGAGGEAVGPIFGFLADGSLAIRAPEIGIDLKPAVSRALLTWLGEKAGVNLVVNLQGALR